MNNMAITNAQSILLDLPFQLILNEVGQNNAAAWHDDMLEIKKFYDVYERGQSFVAEGTNGDYTPAMLHYKKAANIINKQARFLFSKSVDCNIFPEVVSDNENEMEIINSKISTLQSFVDIVLEANSFSKNLSRAARDCFIGKRVALMLNFNESGINLDFYPALNFIYELSTESIDTLTKLTVFSLLNKVVDQNAQRIYMKRYEIKEDGMCYATEHIYDGSGRLIEEVLPEKLTAFDYIPGTVIINDGLLGDIFGESDISLLQDYEGWYSRLANADKDAERQSMNPIRYTIDASPNSTKNLSIAAGAFWDIATDGNTQNPNAKADVGQIESNMGYSEALAKTLDRLDNVMYDSLDVPNTSSHALKGMVTSGKTLKALYWPLIVRCDEKMLSWKPSLQHIVSSIIDGATRVPESARVFISEPLPTDIPFSVETINQYPLPEDEAEEKQIDIAQVNAQVMSKKTYMKKWLSYTDVEADNELKQIATERQILEEAYFPPGV